MVILEQSANKNNATLLYYFKRNGVHHLIYTCHSLQIN